MYEFFINPWVIGMVVLVVAVLVFKRMTHQATIVRRVDEIASEGEEQKDLKGDPRDSRKQGVVAIKSDIENSERPKSGRSEGSMEERVHKLQRQGIIVDRPLSLHEATANLEQAQEELDKVRNAAKWSRTPALLIPKVRAAEAVVEICREEHNRITIEARDRASVCRGKVRSGRQHFIGSQTPHAV